jgi:hypothetical protein
MTPARLLQIESHLAYCDVHHGTHHQTRLSVMLREVLAENDELARQVAAMTNAYVSLLGAFDEVKVLKNHPAT